MSGACFVAATESDRQHALCLEMFRRAFAGNDDAWTAIYYTFSGLIRGWIGGQQGFDPDDIVQETFASFARFAPKSLNLAAHDQLAPVLAYLQRCAKTAILRQYRHKQAAQHLHTQIPGLDEAIIQDIVSNQHLDDEVVMRQILRERIAQLLFDDDERLVYWKCLVQEYKPSELVALHPHRFAAVKSVNLIQNRIIRRLRNDQALRDLVSLAPEDRQKLIRNDSLSEETLFDHTRSRQHRKQRHDQDQPHTSDIRALDQEEETGDMHESCHLDQEQLLSYVLGSATPTLRAAVEHSPVCIAMAQQLAQDIAPLLSWLHRLECPDIETLLAYHERQLDSTAQLVLYRHIEMCPHCQAEIQILDHMSAQPLESALERLRRLVEAVFQAPLTAPQALRGDLLTFVAPTVTIHLSTRMRAGQPRSWTLHGQVRTPDGLQLQNTLEAVELYDLDQSDLLGQQAQLSMHASFVFRDLSAGHYRLHLLTNDEEIVIRQLIIGYDH